jgi:2-polyprenyl-6-methoxyphenol hydroxylase-like FAD-dependent oxidoreductase
VQTNEQHLSAQVLIVGAGPVGLAAAIELGLRGIDVLVIEKQAREGYHPRAKTTHVRTVEHMRRWGIAEKLRAASPLPADYPTDVIFTTRLFGHELAHFENAFFGDRRRDERFNEAAQWIPQYKVEAVLRERVLTLPTVTLRNGLDFIDAQQTPTNVLAKARAIDSNDEIEIRSQYLIGADGLGSAVRRALGIAMTGERNLGSNVNVIMRCPALGAHKPGKPAIMYWIVNPQSPGALSPMDSGDVWAFMGPVEPGQADLSESELRRRIDLAVGHHVDCDLLAIDYWTASRAVANSYGNGRVYLAGDACHVHPPFGGYGMNMGIADAVDIGWKLAAVLQGWGGELLLASYEIERRQVHDAVMDEAVKNNALLSQHLAHENLEDETPQGEAARTLIGARILEHKANEFHTLGIVLGVNYSGSPLTVADGTEAPAHSRFYTPSAHPGCLAPHLWLADGSSLYDHFGPGFTLLVNEPGHEAQIAALTEACFDAQVPLTIFKPQEPRLKILYGAGLALIRPDQYVAWRGDDVGTDAATIIDRIRGA